MKIAIKVIKQDTIVGLTIYPDNPECPIAYVKIQYSEPFGMGSFSAHIDYGFSDISSAYDSSSVPKTIEYFHKNYQEILKVASSHMFTADRDEIKIVSI